MQWISWERCSAGQSLKTRNNDCRCDRWKESCLWLDGVYEPEKRETKQKVGSTMQTPVQESAWKTDGIQS